MAQGAGFVRVPPQSTGRRVATEVRTQVAFDNLTGEFNVGDTVTGSTSGASGIITSISQDGFGATEGLLWLRDVTNIFQNNENLQVAAATQAVVNTNTFPVETYDYAQNVIIDPDNPLNKQRIDRFGAQRTTFTDGSPNFGSFGTLLVGEPQIIKDYRYAYNGLTSQFTDEVVGAGSVSYVSASSAMLLSTGTASGDIASRTSNFYHPYAPGVGHLAEITLRHGDAGKANSRRRWGYFDDNNGVFWELDGTTLYVVVRSNVSGSIVDTRIAQSSWNADKLDGSDSIGFTLDVTNPNIYFIDLQWLGAGRIRFGIVEPGGSRIMAHVVENSNQSGDYPYMRTATLPIRIEMVNTGAAASTSEIRHACAAVKHASKALLVGDRHTYGTPALVTVLAADGEVPVVSIRPKTTFAGLANHGYIKFLGLNITNITNTGAGPVLFRVRQSASSAALTASDFQSHSAGSIAEEDITASDINISLAHESLQFMLLAQTSQYIQVNDSRELHALELFLNADETTQPVFTVTAQCLTGTSASVFVGVNAEEIKL